MGSFESADHSSPQCLRSFCTLEGEPHRTPMGLSRPLARVLSPTQRECQAPPPCPQCHLVARDAPTGSACEHDSSADLEMLFSSSITTATAAICQGTTVYGQHFTRTRDFKFQNHLACRRRHCARFTGEEARAQEVTEVAKVCTTKKNKAST